jgi:hypothetical protein
MITQRLSRYQRKWRKIKGEMEQRGRQRTLSLTTMSGNRHLFAVFCVALYSGVMSVESSSASHRLARHLSEFETVSTDSLLKVREKEPKEVNRDRKRSPSLSCITLELYWETGRGESGA